DRSGKYVKEWGELGTRPGQFSIPHAIGVDSAGHLYVADRNNVRVQVFDQKGKLLDVWNNLLVPWGVCVTAKDEVWVCGSSPKRGRGGKRAPAVRLGGDREDLDVIEEHGAVAPVGVQGQELDRVPAGGDGEGQGGVLGVGGAARLEGADHVAVDQHLEGLRG